MRDYYDLQKRNGISEATSLVPTLRMAVRGLLLVVVFVTVGFITARQVTKHASKGGAAVSQVRLTAAMAGLFAGGATALLLGVAMATRSR